MSAAELGERLLGECAETLDETLFSLRLNSSYWSGHFGSSSFGDLLVDGKDEDAGGGPPFVEITTERAGDSEIKLLYYIITLAVLPYAFRGVRLKGKRAAVVFVDCDDRFDSLRLARAIAGYVRSQLEEAVSDEAEFTAQVWRLIQDSLENVHVFRPQSIPSVAATLQGLQEYMFDFSKHSSASRPLHSIIVSGLSSLVLPLKAAEELSKIEQDFEMETDTARSQVIGIGETTATVKSLLKESSKIFSCAVLVTTWSHALGEGSNRMLRSNLPSGWYSPEMVRLELCRGSDVRREGTENSHESTGTRSGLVVRSIKPGDATSAWFDVSRHGVFEAKK